MSRDLPEKPSLEYLRKQASQLFRTIPHGKLAGAQHTLANEYGFAKAKLKSHVVTLGLNPAEAFTVAVCDNDAQRARELLQTIGNCRQSSTNRCQTTVLENMHCSQQYSEAIWRRSMCCCIPVPTSENEPSGGRAGSVCWMIAIRT